VISMCVRKRTDVLVAPETVFRIVLRLHFTKSFVIRSVSLRNSIYVVLVQCVDVDKMSRPSLHGRMEAAQVMFASSSSAFVHAPITTRSYGALGVGNAVASSRISPAIAQPVGGGTPIRICKFCSAGWGPEAYTRVTVQRNLYRVPLN
jgi:hypothetical protein